VATNGNDGATGTIGAPFATIQKAADVMGVGDTCFIRGGNYHEEVVIDNLDGTSGSPIVFTAYSNEVVTLDGSQAVEDLGSTGWAVHSGNVYKTALSSDISQVFVDGEWMMLARWPNARFDDESAWTWDNWAQGNESLSTPGHEYDAAANGHDLAATALDMTDAMAVLNIGNFATRSRVVTNHAAGVDNFMYGDSGGTYKTVSHYFFFDSKLNLLDNETEWYFDPSGKTLYLWAPGGGVPENVRGKNQDNAFFFTDSEYIQVKGLNFFATTFRMDNCDDMTVEDCDLNYPCFNKRTLGDTGEIFGTLIKNSSQVSILNCSFANTDGLVIKIWGGTSNTVENCTLHHLDYTVAHHSGNSGFIWWKNSSFGVFRQNTVYLTGASEGVMTSDDMLVELNDFSGVGQLQNDGAVVHLFQGHENVDVVRNWFHGNRKPALRMSDGPKDYLPPAMEVKGVARNNVVFDQSFLSLQFKGDLKEGYNNLTEGYIRYSDDSANPTTSLIHANSICINNATGDYIDFVAPTRTETNNWEEVVEGVPVETQVRDWANLDFRPATGSDFINAGSVVPGVTDGYLGSAPDIGAYESGKTSYWIPGRKLAQATMPVPPDGTYGVKPDADLMWRDGYTATSHDVYLGTNPASLVSQGNQSNNIFNPGALSTNTVYYWRVDAITPSGTVTGEVWSFTLGSPPVFVSDPVVKSSAVTGLPYAGSLAADAVDADGDTITFTKLSGPAWLSVAANGSLSGTPTAPDLGLNQFTVQAADGVDGSNSATMNIEVILAGTVVLSEFADAPSENLIATNLISNGIWNNITVANNNGVSNESMYGQTFIHTNDFLLQSVSFRTGDTKSYGSGQTLELAILEDSNSNSVPDTVVGSVYSVPFESIDGSKPWKTLSLATPQALKGNKAYGFVYTLIGPISNNLRVDTDSTKNYPGGQAVNTSYLAGSFPDPLPPSLNGGRDLVFAVQGTSDPAAYYALWSSQYSIVGESGYHEDPDTDGLDNLAEYGLGGAPDDLLDAPYPTFENLEYVYRRRTDAAARGLSYALVGCTNLLTNTWSAVINPPSGIAPLETGFEAVTNQIPATEANQFIRLQITID